MTAQHTECLVEWFKTHDTCIVCRKKISDLTGTTKSVEPERDQCDQRDQRDESTESVSTSERRRSTQDDSDDRNDRNDRNDNFSNTFMSALMMSALMGSGTSRSEHTRSGSGCPCGRDHGQELSSAIDRYANITASSNRLRRSTSPDDSDSSDAEAETKHEDVD